MGGTHVTGVEVSPVHGNRGQRRMKLNPALGLSAPRHHWGLFFTRRERRLPFGGVGRRGLDLLQRNMPLTQTP